MNTLIEKILAFKNLNAHQINQLYNRRVLSNFLDCQGMKPFVDRILKAKERKEKIFIGGDYDADGMCATAIMIDTFKHLGITCGYYIPNRITEGYGLNSITVEKVYEKGYQVILTVDNGVKSIEAINKAQSLGVDCLVSDHHTFETPPPCPLLHAFTMGEKYQYLSGAGVALALARNLGVVRKEHVVLAGIALLADMMPVWEENRVIIQHAIQYLNEGVLPSVQKFKSAYDSWNEMTISFAIVPKLNAVGRLPELMDINKMIPFLLSRNPEEIQMYYQKLISINEKRKEKSKEMISIATSLMKDYEFPIIHSSAFHEGIVGIVAGKIVNEHQKPVAVFSKKGNLLKGSARSIPGLSLVKFFDDFKQHFIQFGGHDGAAGILMEEEKLPLLYEYIKTQEIPPSIPEKTLEVTLNDLTIENVKALDTLRPFGVNFTMPVFELKDIRVEKQTKLGNKPHYKLEFSSNLEILFFNQQNWEYDDVRTIKFNQITLKKVKAGEKITIIAIT